MHNETGYPSSIQTNQQPLNLPSAAAAFSGSDWLRLPRGPLYPVQWGWERGCKQPKLPPYRSWGTWRCRKQSRHQTGHGWACGTCHHRCFQRWTGPWHLLRRHSQVAPQTAPHPGPVCRGEGTPNGRLIIKRRWVAQCSPWYNAQNYL